MLFVLSCFKPVNLRLSIICLGKKSFAQPPEESKRHGEGSSGTRNGPASTEGIPSLMSKTISPPAMAKIAASLQLIADSSAYLCFLELINLRVFELFVRIKEKKSMPIFTESLERMENCTETSQLTATRTEPGKLLATVAITITLFTVEPLFNTFHLFFTETGEGITMPRLDRARPRLPPIPAHLTDSPITIAFTISTIRSTTTTDVPEAAEAQQEGGTGPWGARRTTKPFLGSTPRLVILLPQAMRRLLEKVQPAVFVRDRFCT